MQTDGSQGGPEDSLMIRTAQHRVGLRVEVTGPGTYANTVAYWRAILAIVQEQHPQALLLIDRIEWKDGWPYVGTPSDGPQVTPVT